MAVQRKLGIYWGDTGISLVELNKDIPVTSSFISFADLSQNAVVGLKNLTEDFRLLDLLQKALRVSSFSSNNAYLSLSSRDVIARWFLIPWMKPEEIQGVVAFEAKKYIPFPLEELIYTYCPSTINKDGVRQIGIALIAIRKTTYERYSNVLVQAGINVVYSEPSAVSIMRVLAHRKYLFVDKLTAILNASGDSGEIVIASQGNVKFIRDFSTRPSQDVSPDAAVELSRAKLFNEVRMSLDFFSRQNVGQEIDQIVAISNGLHQQSFSALAEDVGIPVQIVDPYQVLDKLNAPPDIGYIRAFGAGLSGGVPQIMDLDLSEGQGKKQDKSEAGKKSAFFILPQVALTGAVILGSLTAIAGSCWWSGGMIEKKQAARAEVSSRLGRFSDTALEDIVIRSERLSKRADFIKTVPFKSSLVPVFIRLVQLLPHGMWLQSVSMSYIDQPETPRPLSNEKSKKKLTASDYYKLKTSTGFTFQGYVSLDDSNQEFALVNQFVETVKSEPLFKGIFSSIELKTLDTTDIQDETARQENGAGFLQKKVTMFSIEMR